jgi:hypothetical protein
MNGSGTSEATHTVLRSATDISGVVTSAAEETAAR